MISKKRSKLRKTKRVTKTKKANVILKFKNILCEFETEGYEPNRTAHIFSGSIFKIKNADITEYLKGLEELIEYMDYLNKTKNANIHFFIYYDSSIEDDNHFINIKKLILKKYKFIKLLKYKCPDFIKEDNHKGLFGTFVRLLPLFEKRYENHIRSITDIDFPNFQKEKYIDIIREKELYSKDNLVVIYPIGYEQRYNNLIINNKIDMIVLANIILKRGFFPMEILRSFLEKVNNNDAKIINEYKIILNNNINIPKKMRNIIADNIKDNLFIYGLDEYFINKYLLGHWFKNNNSIGVFYYIPFTQNFFLNNYINDKIINNPRFNDFLKDLFLDKYDSDIPLEKYMNKISNRFCNYSSVNTIKEYEKKYENVLHFYKTLVQYKNILNIDSFYIKIMKNIADNKYVYIDIIFHNAFNEPTPERKELKEYLVKKMRVRTVFY